MRWGRSEAGFRLPPVCNIGRQVEQGRNQDVKAVQKQGDVNPGNPRKQPGQYKKLAGKVHIIRAEGGVIQDICRNGHDQAGNAGVKQLLPAADTGIAVHSGEEHDKIGKKHAAVIEESVKSGKGNAGITGEPGNGKEKIDDGAQDPQGGEVAEGHLLCPALSPEHDRQNEHEKTAGIEGQTGGAVQSFCPAGQTVPGDDRHFPDQQKDPDTAQYRTDFFLLPGEQHGTACDDRQKNGFKQKTQRRKQGAGDLPGGDQIVLMGKEVPQNIAERFHHNLLFGGRRKKASDGGAKESYWLSLYQKSREFQEKSTGSGKKRKNEYRLPPEAETFWLRQRKILCIIKEKGCREETIWKAHWCFSHFLSSFMW